jgi:hypothetical protein
MSNTVSITLQFQSTPASLEASDGARLRAETETSEAA